MCQCESEKTANFILKEAMRQRQNALDYGIIFFESLIKWRWEARSYFVWQDANAKPKKYPGLLEGKLIVPDNFDDPLPPRKGSADLFRLAASGCVFDKEEYIQHIQLVGEASLTQPRGKKTIFRGALY